MILCTGKSSCGLVESSAMLGLLLFSFYKLEVCSACSTTASTKALSILEMLSWKILEDAVDVSTPKSASLTALFTSEF